MAKSTSQKLKILYLLRILLSETDDEHGLTMPSIIERLAEKGIDAERKSLYDDINLLRLCGYDIIARNAPRTEYAIGARDFEIPELHLLVGAVLSARFLTKKKSDKLIEHLKKLASVHQAQQLSKSLYVEGRIKMENEIIYYNLDKLEEALRKNCKVSFKYFKYNTKKERFYRREESLYVENPLYLIYSDDYYYLIAYNEREEKVKHYRPDRMTNIKVLESEPIAKNSATAELDIGKYSMRAFSMFGGEDISTTLLIKEDLAAAIIDRFGKEVSMYPLRYDTAGHTADKGAGACVIEGDLHDERGDGFYDARVHVKVKKSGAFFGWLAQFGTQVKIEKPLSLAQEYRAFLEEIAKEYE